MVLGKNYQNSAQRHIFRLRDPELFPQKDFAASTKTPLRYSELSDEQKLDVAEFITFVIENRVAIDNNEVLHFHMRDHENRPTTTKLSTPKNTPKDYAKLNEKEKQHVFEFISFLLKKESK